MSTCIVIGGGASGMMAAIAASDNGENVILLEKNEKLGKKVYITGKGRCNVTNNCDADVFFNNIVTNPKFMYSSFYTFDNNALMALIEEGGCHLKVERGERVFPVSDHSSDILRSLDRLLRDRKVDIRLETKVEDLIVEDGKTTGVILKDKSKLYADRVIIATGGLSYQSTGSDGFGQRLLAKYGHTICECKPALVPFCTREDWCRELQGLSLKNVTFKLYGDKECKKKPLYEGFGEMMFTHFGITGPLILTASSYYVRNHFGKEAYGFIDLKTALDEETLDKRILRDFSNNSNKSFKNAIGDLLPNKMIPVVIMLCGINPDKKVNEITHEERMGLVKLLKRLPVTIYGVGDYNEAIITQGGINVKEVEPSTMKSKIIDNLYIVGELLDVDALTGGFNLQVAWSTGYLAGISG